tara:strand:- start:3617 stop:3835 length:219 start_codon:yes stop_codon:yes gene_type:complete
MKGQKLKVLYCLQTRKSGITSWDAIKDLRITRLAARINDLREEGFKIHTEMECSEADSKKRFARYTLISRNV